MSNLQKRDVLWNMIDPGDPYDIKKSIIAKLPGDNKIFMGDHLQLIVLFQGAQIQRLIESLDDYKLKYKGLEKVELDRHSYEVQIRELTELCEINDSFKNENIRLKDFAARQTSKIQQLERQLQGVDQDMNYKYQQALQKIDKLISQNSSLKGELNSNKTKMLAFERSKNRQIDDLRYEINQRKISQQHEVSDIKSNFNSQLIQLEGDIKRYKQKLENERVTIDELRYNQNRMTMELQQYKSRLTDSSNNETKLLEYKRKLETFNSEKDRLQGILNQKSREASFLKSQLESQETLINRLNQNIRNLETRITRQQEQIRRLRGQNSTNTSPQRNNEVGNLRRKNEEYQQQLALVSQQTERLNNLLETKNQKLRETERKYSLLEQDYSNLKNRIDSGSYDDSDFKKQNTSQFKRKIAYLTNENERLKKRQETIREELENQIQHLKQQVEILNKRGVGTTKPLEPRPPVPIPPEPRPSGLSSDDTEYYGQQIEQLRRRLQLKQRQIINYKQRITQLNKLLQASNLNNDDAVTPVKVDENTRRKLRNFQTQNNELKRQVQQMSTNFHRQQQQISRLNTQVIRLRRLQIPEPSSSLTNSKIDKHTKSQNDQLRMKLIQWSKQIQRLNEVIQTQLNDIIRYKENKEQLQIQIQRYETKIQQLNHSNSNRQDISTYQVRIQQLNRIIQDGKRQIVELQRSSNKPTNNVPRLQALSLQNTRLQQEVQRLNRQLLSNKQSSVPGNYEMSSLKEQINRLNENIRRKDNDILRIQDENTRIQNTLITIRNESTIQTQKINQYESAISELRQRNEQFTNASNINNNQQNSLVSQLRQYEQKLVMVTSEIERQSNLLRQKDQQINNLNRMISELQSHQGQETQSLQNNFKNQINEANRRISILTQQNENIKRNIVTLENQSNERGNNINRLAQELDQAHMTINSHVQAIKTYERTYNDLVPYKQQLQQKIKQQQQIIQENKNKMIQLATQIQRINANLSQKVQQSEQLKRRLNEFSSKYNQLFSQYENVVNTANNHNAKRQQQIQHGIKQYEQTIIQLKRQLDESQRGSENMVRQFAEAQAKIHMFSSEIQRLNNAIGGKVNEYQNLFTQFNNAKTIIQQQKTQSDRLRGEYQRQINQLSAELQRLSQMSHSQKTGFISQIQRLNNALRLKVQQSQEWQNQSNALNTKLQEVTQLYNQLLPQYEASRGRMAEFQQKFNRLAEQFQRLSIIISTQKEENFALKSELSRFGNLEQMNRRLSAQIDRLNKQKQELEQDIGQLRMRYADQAALQKRLNEQLALFVVLFAQIESLRKRVKDKQKQVEEVRRSSLAPFRV